MTAGPVPPSRRPVGHRRPAPRVRVAPGQRGSVLFVVALSLTVLVTCTALTVDLGRVSTLRRDLQNVADATALDMVRLVDGRTATEVVTDPRWQATLDASLARNGFVPGGAQAIEVAVGTYDAVAEEFTVVTGTAVPRAVRVIATDRLDYAFAPGGSTNQRQAVASQQATAAVRIGSFAARLNSARSALLQGILGDALGVSAVSYQGLAGGSVGLGDLASELGFTLGSTDEAFSTSVSLVDMIRAQADALRLGGDPARAALLDQVALGLPAPAEPVDTGDVVAVVGGEEAAATSEVDALELLTATAFVANGDHFIAVPDTTLSIPGLVDQTSRLQVIEAPVVAAGPVGASAHTAQIRLETTLTISVANLVTATINLEVEVAAATATIADIGCRSPQRLAIDVTTGLATAEADITARVLGSLPILGSVAVADVTAHADTMSTPTADTLTFVLPPDELGVRQQYTGPVLDLAGAAVTVDSTTPLGPLSGLVGSLVTTALSTVIGPALDQLDTALLQPVLALLGVAVDGADVTPLAITCGDRGLVA